MVKPGTKAAANLSIRALMTNQKRPRLTSVIGNVRIFEEQTESGVHQADGERAINAVPKPAMSKPADDMSDDDQAQCAENPINKKVQHTVLSLSATHFGAGVWRQVKAIDHGKHCDYGNQNKREMEVRRRRRG